MATSIPADLMKLSGEIGSIKVGMRADLIAMDLNDYSC
jgi:imidazolonepropionase-like amidohydrolase